VKPGHEWISGTRSVLPVFVFCSLRQCAPAFRCPSPTTTERQLFLCSHRLRKPQFGTDDRVNSIIFQIPIDSKMAYLAATSTVYEKLIV